MTLHNGIHAELVEKSWVVLMIGAAVSFLAATVNPPHYADNLFSGKYVFIGIGLIIMSLGALGYVAALILYIISLKDSDK